ncbi:MAG TPA: sulfite exporter TauE/SafE family protein [Candidatus Udaeobacter sp.]|nr:sulfite exporter TauE/SafE family protein [Candidatus Udaeobacter sp.]
MPLLVLGATIIVVLRPILVRRRENGSVRPDLGPILWPVAMVGIFLVALYGGYFGAGIGILMIGALTLISPGEIRTCRCTEEFFEWLDARGRVLVLVLEGNVDWKYGAPMAIGGLVGGYIGGALSHRANRTFVRWIVIGIGLAVSAYYFWKLYGHAVMRVGRNSGIKEEICNQSHLGSKFLPNVGTSSAGKIETCIRKEDKHHEKAKCNYSGIHSIVWRCCFSGSQPGQNLGSNRSSRRNVAGRESFDRTWLGWYRKGALVG